MGENMRLTLNVNDKIINEVMNETGIKNKTMLINLSLDEMLKKIKREKLKELRGKICLDIDLDKYRNMDLKNDRKYN